MPLRIAMAHLCITCQAISRRGLDDLGLQLLPEGPVDDGVWECDRKDWASNLFYLHHSNVEELRMARDGSRYFCSLIDVGLREIIERNLVDIDEYQVLLVYTITPPEKYYLIAWISSKCSSIDIHFPSESNS